MLGYRRGWLLLIAQPIAIVVVAVLAVTLIDGTRWLVVFPPLLALLVFWIGQAIDAHQRALKLGAQPGGEISVVLLLPVVLTVLSLFWLLGGRHGSPTATLQEYIEAWQHDKPDAAAMLLSNPVAASDVSADWAREKSTIVGLVGAGYSRYGDESGLDPDRPFDSLRFREPVQTGAGTVSISVELVRNQRVQTTVLGIIPTAGQQEVTIQPALTIYLVEVAVESPSWLPVDTFDSYAWKISDVEETAPNPS